jgi:DNA-binding NarL/FixJ family response regulator
MVPIRVFLVDDSAEFLDSAERFLATDPQIEVVGRALSGPEALKRVAELHPDLVLMDLVMPGMNGLEVTRQIKAQPSAPCVVILTLYDKTEYGAAAKTVQADGFIGKREFGTHLLPFIYKMFNREECCVKRKT